MATDKEWEEFQEIVEHCADEADLDAAVIYHAKIMLYLICHKARTCQQPEAAIRWLYAEFADAAVQEYLSPNRGRYSD